jgi:DNA-binding NarL/FixJ family response regulator
VSVISIVIVENDPDRLAALTSAFGEHEDLTVLSAVSKRETALKQLALLPDVLLLNPEGLKRFNIPRLLRTLRTRSPKTRLILLLTTNPGDDVLIENIRQGARGYLLSSSPPALIAKAVRSAAAGGIWAERRILEKAISMHQLLLPELLQTHVPELQPLTSREMDMLGHVLKGATNREIAEMSNISERTVKTHLYRVYRKLNVKSRTKAIALLTQ